MTAEPKSRAGSPQAARGTGAVPMPAPEVAWAEGPRSPFVPRMGQPGRHKWAFAAVWLVYLIGPLVSALHADKPLWWKLLNFGALGTFAVAYCLLAFTAFPRSGVIGTAVRRSSAAMPLVTLLAVLAFACSWWLNDGLVGMWIYVGSAAGMSLPIENKRAQTWILIAVAGVSLTAWHVDARIGDWLSVLFPTGFAGLATIGIRQMTGLIGELREAREQVARLAANEERLRLARDLHDLTGHSLSLITLKAELAQRMIERADRACADATEHGGVPAEMAPALGKALKEVTEIEQVSRQSLSDIREAVSGYRRPTLAVELASAGAALDVAGIKLESDPAIAESSGSHDPEIEGVLAWCLREAVTNAIRHSGATKVRVRLEERDGELVLSVLNNGRGLAQAANSPGGAGAGNGLRGLRERLNAVDGRISVGGTDGDFRLIAAVPLAS